MATTVYRVTIPSAYRRAVLNTQTGKVARFTVAGGDSAYAVVERAAALLGDDLTNATLTYGGSTEDRQGRDTAKFYVATES